MILFLGLKLEVYAASASADISVSTTSTVVGNSGTAKLTISSDVPIAQIWGTFSCGGLGKQDLSYSATTNPSKSKTYTINWKAKTEGTYTCEVTGLEVGILDGSDTGSWPTVTTKSKTIKVVKATSSSANNSNKGNSTGSTSDKKEYSSDNTLKSLSVDEHELTPAFNKDTTEYKLTVDQSIEKIKINASANDSKASVAGTGEVNLANGENTIEIKVTAENGNVKTYKLIATVSDLNPINIKIGEEDYTIVKKNNGLKELLEYYNETTLTINEQDVIAYENTETNVTLVLLKNANNEMEYYIYDKIYNTYTKYRYIKVGNVTLQLLDNSNKLDNYKKYDLELQNEIIDYYKIKGSHKVGLIYGTNIKSGNTGYYVYDSNEETLSKYYNEEVKIYKNQVQEYKNYLMIFIGIVSFISVIVIAISFKKSRKKKNNYYSL